MRRLFTKKFWLAVDVWINVHIFRGQKETISDRLGENLMDNDHGILNWRYHLCKFLSWIERLFTQEERDIKHCEESVHKKD